jgi:hypothetical protein
MQPLVANWGPSVQICLLLLQQIVLSVFVVGVAIYFYFGLWNQFTNLLGVCFLTILDLPIFFFGFFLSLDLVYKLVGCLFSIFFWI